MILQRSNEVANCVCAIQAPTSSSVSNREATPVASWRTADEHCECDNDLTASSDPRVSVSIALSMFSFSIILFACNRSTRNECVFLAIAPDDVSINSVEGEYHPEG